VAARQAQREVLIPLRHRRTETRSAAVSCRSSGVLSFRRKHGRHRALKRRDFIALIRVEWRKQTRTSPHKKAAARVEPGGVSFSDHWPFTPVLRRPTPPASVPYL
jgi:hypothetical protein